MAQYKYEALWPEPMKDWIEARIKEGEYASTSDYVHGRERHQRQIRIGHTGQRQEASDGRAAI